MTTRSEIVEGLRRYYTDQHISVGPSFACPHRGECEQLASPRPLLKGMEAHVGSRFGEGRRIVVVSLDSGNSSESLNNRTNTVEPITPEKSNPHMRGTTRFVRLLIDLEHPPEYPMAFAAMLNSAKCAGADGRMDHVPKDVYRKCNPYLLGELQILQPTLIWVQGSMVRDVLKTQLLALTEVDSKLHSYLDLHECDNGWLAALLKPVVTEYLRLFRLRGFAGREQQVVTVLTPHPSDRYGRWGLFERAFMRLVASLAGDFSDISSKN